MAWLGWVLIIAGLASLAWQVGAGLLGLAVMWTESRRG